MDQFPLGTEENVFHLNSLPKRAGFSIRLVAYLIDRVIIAIIEVLFVLGAIAIVIATGDGSSSMNFANHNFFQALEVRLTIILLPLYIAIIVVKAGYFTYFIGSTGQTIGKMIVGIQVVPSKEKEMSYSKALLRWFGYIASSVPLFLGFLWVAIDKDREAWHDKIAGTYVRVLE